MRHEIFLFDKTLDLKEINQIIKIVENIPEIELDNISIKNVSRVNGIKEYINKRIEDVSEAKKYFGEIDKIESVAFNLKVKNTKSSFSLHYNEYAFFVRGWNIEYNQNNAYVDAFVYNIKKIFRPSILDVYNSIRYMGLFVMWFISIITLAIDNQNITNIIVISQIIYILDCVLRRRKAYKRSTFFKEHKDEIILGVIFYVLGVITPYIINLAIHIR